MSRILLAWELGENLGHIAALRSVALELRKQGHECCFAVRDLYSSEEYLEPEVGSVLQAPLRLSTIRNPFKTQISYAHLLHNTGFDDVLGLAGRIRAWREILEARRFDLVIAEHAPTAIVAASSFGIPVLQIGTGFMVPPMTAPFSAFSADARVSSDALLRDEAGVLNTLREACLRVRIAAPASLQDAFSGGSRVLLSYPELDHYQVQRADPFLGVPNMSKGVAPEWAAGTGPKIFAYLRPSKNLESVLSALGRLPARVLVRVGGASAGHFKGHERDGMRIVDHSIDMKLAALDCDAFVNYAAHGLMAEMFLAGKPGLLLPGTVERMLVANCARKLGAAIAPSIGQPFSLSRSLRQLIDDKPLQHAAKAFSDRYRNQSRAKIPEKIAEISLNLIKKPNQNICRI